MEEKKDAPSNSAKQLEEVSAFLRILEDSIKPEQTKYIAQVAGMLKAFEKHNKIVSITDGEFRDREGGIKIFQTKDVNSYIKRTFQSSLGKFTEVQEKYTAEKEKLDGDFVAQMKDLLWEAEKKASKIKTPNKCLCKLDMKEIQARAEQSDKMIFNGIKALIVV